VVCILEVDDREVIWSQKYRPQTVESCIMSDSNRAFFQGLVDNKEIVNMTLGGDPGCGKTTMAKILVNQLGCEYLFLNGSGEDRGISTVKTKIANFVTTHSLFGEEGMQKVVIFDEADNLTADAQAGLRSLIEENSKNCAFILTANYPGKIIDALKSRCKLIMLDPEREERKPLMVQMVKRSAQILKTEGVEFDVEALKSIVISSYPDYRSIIGSLQYYATRNNTIDAIAVDLHNKETTSAVVGLLKEKDFRSMVEWVYGHVTDPLAVMNFVSRRAFDIFEADGVPMVVVILDEYMSKYSTVPDKHLSLIACLTKIMAECNVK